MLITPWWRCISKGRQAKIDSGDILWGLKRGKDAQTKAWAMVRIIVYKWFKKPRHWWSCGTQIKYAFSNQECSNSCSNPSVWTCDQFTQLFLKVSLGSGLPLPGSLYFNQGSAPFRVPPTATQVITSLLGWAVCRCFLFPPSLLASLLSYKSSYQGFSVR